MQEYGKTNYQDMYSHSELTEFIDSQPFTPPRILKRFVKITWWKRIASKDFVFFLARAHFASRHPKKRFVEDAKKCFLTQNISGIGVKNVERQAGLGKNHVFREKQKRENKKTANPSSYAHMFYAAKSLFCIDAILCFAVLGGNPYTFTSKRIL